MKTMKSLSFNLLMLMSLGALSLLFSCGEESEEPLPEPVSEFTVSNDNPLAGEEITFTNSSTEATSFQWSFGDGETSTDENPSHTYSSEGSYTVTLSVTGEGGNNSSEASITVKYPRMIISDGVFDIDGADTLGIDTYIFSVDMMAGSSSQIGNYPDDTDRHFPVTVSNDGSKMYYVDNFSGILYEANVDGSNETEIVSTSDLFYPSDIALDADGNFYVTDRGDSDTGAGAAIHKITPSGTVTQLYTDADGFEVPTAIAIDQATGDIYVNDVGATDSGYAADGIWKGNIDGSAPSKEISGGGYAIGLDPVNGMVYYNDAFVDGNIKMASTSDLSTQSKFADLDESNAYGIQYFMGRVYWSDLGPNISGGEGKIMRAAADGSNPTTVLTDLVDPRGIAIFE